MASLYTVYLDESGTHDESEAVEVAGFVSNATEWEAFSEKWQQVLTKSGLEYFRMSEFESSQGQFSGWAKPAREDLLNKLLPIIHDHTFWSIGCIVLKKEFDSIVSRAAKRVCGDAYGLAALSCWRNLGQVLQDNDAWMACSMEEGVKGKGALQIYFEEQSKRPTWREQNRILGLSFQEKRVPPLQAADILAYELYKKSERQFGKVTLADRYPLKVLGTKNHQWLYFQKKHLREYSEDVDRQIAQFSSDSAT